ncbi:MAG: lamin tail domain-containing protein, partial [Verrucomicrobia bacterium]|nr:lamin tail domain-containing protein [Verrucomicrobiota bacterium]
VVLESARWGDSKASTPFTRDRDWLAEANRIQRDYFPQRSSRVLDQFRNQGWYPAVVAPSFSQHGGAFAAGTQVRITAPAGVIYYTTDGSDPRAPGGAVAAGARTYSGPLTLSESVLLRSRVRTAAGAWSALNEAEFFLIQTWQDVLITEVMYHPPSTETADTDDLEFLELKNVGAEERDLGGLTFTNGIRYTFPRGTRLAPGRFLVLASRIAAFTNAHPDVAVAGEFSGRLSNSGERLTLVHATGATVFDMTWSDDAPWPTAPDGTGFSLVPRNPSANPNPSDPAAWRASAQIGGSPGADDPAANVAPVVINELLSHTDFPVLDQVELHNPTATPADVGGWFLTDDRRTAKKYRIPGPRVIPAGGYLVLSEADFNAPGAANAFTFSSHGDEVYLYSADAAGNLTGHSDGFAFGASANGVTFGRHTNSVGEVQFPTQAARTLGAVNAGPAIGPVVINEIRYAPAAGDVEFVEIANLTGDDVPLFDPENPGNTWRIAGADFSFPPGSVLPARGFAVAAAGNPAQFRVRWQIPDSVPVYGPFAGNLADNGERLELQRPDSPDPMTNELGIIVMVVPYVAVDGVRYNDRLPWPPEAAGRFSSLERRTPGSYGDDPAAWRAAASGASPGLDNSVNRPPIPNAGVDQDLVAGAFPTTAQLAATALDDGQPGGGLRFRWTQVGGPAGVVFSDPGMANPVVALPGQGDFLFRVTVSDGEREATDDVGVSMRRTAVNTTFLAAGSTWRYLDLGINPNASWRTNGFNDGGWKSGRARFGYGDGGMVTTIEFGPDAGSKFITSYFRTRFTVTGLANVTELTARLLRDDGAVIYINGIEAARSNMPETAITPATRANGAIGGADESTFFDVPLDRDLLREGENVVAVEIHQSDPGSSDLAFDLELVGQILPPNQAPTANAGADRSAVAGEATPLSGAFTDDGLPIPPGAPVFLWSRISGPGEVAFANPGHPRTTAQFAAPGSYTLRFTVNDGVQTATDDVVFTVTTPNTPPAVGVVGGAKPGLRFTAEAGRSYTVLSRTRLTSGAWERLRDIPAGADATAVEVPFDSPDPSRFYQVVSPQLP